MRDARRNALKPNIFCVRLKKCLQKMKEHTSESRFTTDFCYPHVVRSSICGGRSCSAESENQSDPPRVITIFSQSFGGKNQWLSPLKCLLSFSGGISSSEVMHSRYVTFLFFLSFSIHLQLISTQTAPQFGPRARFGDVTTLPSCFRFLDEYSLYENTVSCLTFDLSQVRHNMDDTMSSSSLSLEFPLHTRANRAPWQLL